MATIRAEGLGKRFLRRLAPVLPTFKERVVAWTRQRSDAGEEIFWALDDVSFEVPAGEMFGVIGSNGCGKSTLLKLLAGIYRPDRGSLECRGRVVSLIELGAGFHPDLTGRENILINGLLLGLTRSQVREREGEIIRFAGLERFIDSPVRTYSSGMYMRLGFAIAAHTDPDILLVDEILAVGDEQFQHQCLRKIAEFLREGKTIVYVSHDLGTVGRFCRRVLWLDGGKVKAIGPPREVIDAYLERVEETEARRLMAAHHRMTVEALAGGGKRWGGREVAIRQVTLRDRGGEERYLFQTGERLVLSLSYEAPQRVEDIVFGIALQREDGVACYGTNTLIDGVPLPAVAGCGEVAVVIEDLALLEGSYYIDVAAHRKDGYPYDYLSKTCRLEVRSAVKDIGVARLTHRWLLGTGG